MIEKHGTCVKIVEDSILLWMDLQAWNGCLCEEDIDSAKCENLGTLVEGVWMCLDVGGTGAEGRGRSGE